MRKSLPADVAAGEQVLVEGFQAFTRAQVREGGHGFGSGRGARQRNLCEAAKAIVEGLSLNPNHPDLCRQ